MAALDRRFCLWRQEVRDGKPTKVPLRSNGAKAKNNDPSTWCTYERAVTALKELRAEGTRIDGIGVLSLPRWRGRGRKVGHAALAICS